ncbi:MAG TPA: CHAT domain-containing protein [Thermoanaerobaculia bacterium]|nr:CHAT domain-containing protein [Thermoanaerobaculia bacterium]
MTRRWSFAAAVAAALAVGAFTLVAASRALRSSRIRPLVRAADAVAVRPCESRLSGGFEYHPIDVSRGGTSGDGDLQVLEASTLIFAAARREPSAENLHAAAVASLLEGRDADAVRAAEQALGNADVLAAIRTSRNAALLTDVAAAEIEWSTTDANALLVALEAADRAWKIERSPEAAWNRALGLERLGVAAVALKAWGDFDGIERSADWKREAAQHVRRLRAHVTPARAGDAIDAEVAFAPQLAARVPGFDLYSAGRDELAREETSRARATFAEAERQLGAAGSSFVFAARHQRIRCDCTEARRTCIADARALRDELRRRNLFPDLAARTAAIEAQAAWNAGRLYDAVRTFDSALHDLDRLGDAAGSTWVHALLANALATAGESDLALRHYLAALRATAAPSDARSVHVFEAAVIFFLRHDALAAADVVLRALVEAPVNDSRVMQLSLSGVLQTRRGEAAAAATSFAAARRLLISLGTGDRERVGAFLDALEAGSRRYTARARSSAELTPTIERYASTSDSVWLPQLLLERGAALEREGRLREAEDDYLRAMSLIEQQQSRVDSLLIGADFTAEGESAFDRAVRLMLRENRIAAALAIADRAHMHTISSSFAAVSGLADPYAMNAHAHGVAEAQRLLHPDQLLIVDYLLHDALITWCISRDRIVAYRRAVQAAAVDAVVQTLRAAAPNERARLSSTMLSAWIGSVPNGTTLIFVPSPQLGALPYALLTNGTEPLLLQHPIAVAASISEFIDAVRDDGDRTTKTSVLFAAAGRRSGSLSPLPLASSEVRDAEANYCNHLVLGDATRNDFLHNAGRFSVIHFAGHALVNVRQPLLSALVFGDDYLYVHELSTETFGRARLVVLSACSTGRTPRPTMSIATALLRRGVPSVVYTLWDVSDDAAAQFSGAFHRSLSRGRTRADAVRDAQLEMLRLGATEWPAFQLAGAPDAITGNERREPCLM